MVDIRGVCKATNFADICIQSCSLFRVEREFRERISRASTQVKEPGQLMPVRGRIPFCLLDAGALLSSAPLRE